jgi:F-type H+-transporting ATPase subunit epsilon
MADMSVDLVSQSKMVWSGSAKSLSAPSTGGQIGILPGHTPLVAVLEPGLVSLTATDGSRLVYRIEKAVATVLAEVDLTGTSANPNITNAAGFLSVDGNLVTVVADVISPVS